MDFPEALFGIAGLDTDKIYILLKIVTVLFYSSCRLTLERIISDSFNPEMKSWRFWNYDQR
jgi:hypothetical protein